MLKPYKLLLNLSNLRSEQLLILFITKKAFEKSYEKNL